MAKLAGWCTMHYFRLRSYDSLDLPTIEQRFWQKVDRSNPDGCWLWLGRKNTSSGGQFQYKGRRRAAHHVAWVLTYGEIPAGLHIRRTCESDMCVRPDHLTHRRAPRPSRSKRKKPAIQQLPGLITDKVCRDCHQVKPVSEFSPNGFVRDGLASYCRPCALRRARIAKGVHPDDAGAQPPENGVCEICEKRPKRGLFLDHDHETGRLRGWLCHGCNSAIGHLADDPDILRAAIAYLERNRAA